MLPARIAAGSALALLACAGPGAGAPGAPVSPRLELRVLAAGATESTFRDVVGDFERTAGLTVSVAFGAVGELRDRLVAGERADLVIATPVILVDLERRGLVGAGERLELGRVGGGIAVCAGASRPAVGTPEALRAALLAARTVHFADPARATAGAHLLEVAEKLGVAAEVRARGRIAPGG
jgi:molybdate transport system substrate-binding protein